MCSWEGLLDLENEKYVVSLSLTWAGLSFSLLLLSSHWSLSTGDKLQLLSLGPSISCLITTDHQGIPSNHCLLIKITHGVSGLTEVQVLYVSVQKEFSERQSDR